MEKRIKTRMKNLRAGTGARLRPSIQVRLEKEDIFFGPGKARLLEYIWETGSVQEACQEMGLSYSKGTRMIKKAEKELGYKLLERWTGGYGGGGSRLTKEGSDLLQKYKEFALQVEIEADRVFQEIFYGQ